MRRGTNDLPAHRIKSAHISAMAYGRQLSSMAGTRWPRQQEQTPTRCTSWSRAALTRPGAAAPLAKVTGMIVTVRVRLRAAGGAKHPSLGPRSGNFAGFKGGLRGLEASFMRVWLTCNQYNDRWVWAPPHPLAHGYPNTRIDETLTPVELHGRRSSDDQQGRGCWEAAGLAAWLQRGTAMSYPRRPRNAVVDHVSISPCGRAPSPTATAVTCQAALPRPSVLPER